MYSVTLGELTFELRTKTTYRQYFAVNKLLRELKFDYNELLKADDSTAGVIFKVGKLITSLMESDKIPEFFATILVPENAPVWKAEFVNKYRELMYDLSDVEIVEMAQSFLLEKGTLIMRTISDFQTFMTGNDTSTQSLEPEEKTIE